MPDDCEGCSDPFFGTTVPGIRSNGERCDYCKRFESDSAALQFLTDKGMTLQSVRLAEDN